MCKNLIKDLDFCKIYFIFVMQFEIHDFVKVCRNFGSTPDVVQNQDNEN